jgi:hypothetical protein
MVKIMYPMNTREFIHDSHSTCTAISQRILPIESVHSELETIGNKLKELIKYREETLKQDNLSVINLSTIVHSKQLDDQGRVLIKINDLVVPIGIAEGVNIHNDFNPYLYSINKIGNAQQVHYADPDDASLHKLVAIYKPLAGMYKYRVGNRIELSIYGGSYKIIHIDHQYATITCKKWQQEGKKNRRVLISDIKCLASNNFNSLSEIEIVYGKRRV